jgi:hypothetical protein
VGTLSNITKSAVLHLSHLSIEPAEMAVWFHGHGREFTATTSFDVGEVTVKAGAIDPGATVSFAGQPLSETGVRLRLNIGINHFKLNLLAPDGRNRDVALRIVRQQPVPDWQQVTNNGGFPQRDSAGELVFDGYMWLMGGYTPKVIRDLWRSRDGATWEQLPDIACEGGINIPMRWTFKDAMWVTTHAGELLRSRDGRNWELVTRTAPWTGRITAGTAVFLDRMWVIGGLQGSKRKNDVWSSTDGVNWKLELEHAPWSPRQLWDNLVVHRGRMWIVGGGVQNYHPVGHCRDVWSSADGVHWECATQQAPWPGRQWTSAVTYRNRMFLLGGYRSEPKWINLNDIWTSDDGATWHELKSPHIWSPRHEISPYVKDGKLWVVAGNSWPLTNDVWTLEITGMMFVTQPVIESFTQLQYRYEARADFHLSGGSLTYRLIGAPAWLAVEKDTGVVHGQLPDEPGQFPIELQATSAAGETDVQSWMLDVLA